MTAMVGLVRTRSSYISYLTSATCQAVRTACLQHLMSTFCYLGGNTVQMGELMGGFRTRLAIALYTVITYPSRIIHPRHHQMAPTSLIYKITEHRARGEALLHAVHYIPILT